MSEYYECYGCKHKAKSGFINTLCLACKRQYPGQEAADRKSDLYQSNNSCGDSQPPRLLAEEEEG